MRKCCNKLMILKEAIAGIPPKNCQAWIKARVDLEEYVTAWASKLYIVKW